VGSATGCSANTTRFTTAAGLPVPACVTNTSPANGAKLATTTVALTWSAAATASSYDIYLWKGATAPTTATATVTGKTTYRAVGLTASSVYNWYVVPKNAAGLGIGCNANATRFITAGALNIPGCVSNISPANGSTLATTTTATLTWNAEGAATSYDVYLWKGATAPATATATVSGTTYSATGLTASGGYSWYVVPKNVAGSATGCNGNATRFTTAAALNVPGCVTNISPASGSTLAAATTATLTWNAAATATSYDVYLWKGATVPATATATVSGTTYSATGLTAGSLYNWYIVPKNGVGQATGCSANKTSFTTVSAPAGGTGDGLKGDYYNSDGLKGSIYLTRTDATVNFDWGTGSPSPVIDANTFSVRWTGLVEPLYSETYTFYTYADEGIRLWVNGRNIINHWKDHSGAEHSATITLTAGAKYEIKMEYNEKKGTALAKLLWSSASTPKAIIPQKQLYLPPLIKIKGRHVKIQEHNDDDDDDKGNDEHGKDGLKTVIYPNPVITGQFAMVEINSNKGGIAIVQVASITGKALQIHQLNVAPGRNSKTLNTAGLRPGIYVITITGNIDKPVILKLVVH
jgi:hypothetical protein